MQNPDPMHIAVVTETYPPEINGVANTMHHLVTGLCRRGHRVSLVRPRQAGERSKAVSGDRILVPGLPLPGYRALRFGLPVYWRLRRLWSRLRPNIVYVATQGPLGYAALHAARRAAIPVATGFHTQFHQYSRHYGLGLLTRPIVGALKRFHNRSDATLVPTEALRIQLGELGFRNLLIFSRGVDTALFNPSRRSQALRSAWGCSERDLVALYVGRIAAEKNIHLALSCMDAVSARFDNLRCVLVGDGPERDRLAREYPSCRFVGAKVGEDLAAHYASGDLFLFPSLTETFGNVVTEAMASGLAVNAFDYAAAHQYLRHGSNGLLATYADDNAFIGNALEALAHPQRLVLMREKARLTAESLGWTHVIEGLEGQLRGLLRQDEDEAHPRDALGGAPSGKGA